MEYDYCNIQFIRKMDKVTVWSGNITTFSLLFVLQFILEEVDITLPENEHWFNKYKYDIPVFHVYEDFICKHRVDLKTFETALEKYEK